MQTRAAEVARTGTHVFHSSFWINLHERLRHEARAKEPAAHGLSKEQQALWDEALAFYKSDVLPKHPIFDR
ncbi:MAG: hypothetical protein ACLGH0_06735, partial [Thermoanaerobaculia bacterium]